MKKTMKKIICLGLLIVSSTAVLPAYAAEVESEVCSQQATEDTAMPCADVIVYQFREKNGVRQYRRWNETKGYWVDPDWIDVPTGG